LAYVHDWGNGWRSTGIKLIFFFTVSLHTYRLLKICQKTYISTEDQDLIDGELTCQILQLMNMNEQWNAPVF